MGLRTAPPTPATKYTFGGDEFVMVEFDEEMSLEINLLSRDVALSIEAANLDGVIDICPANVSLLVRFDPDRLHGEDLIQRLREIEATKKAETRKPFATRVIDVPVLFQDPWTTEVLMKFRDRVQDPTCTDIEYLARVNGLEGPEEFIAALTRYPSMCSLTGFLPGVVWAYQLVPREMQLQGPKYVRPRTETPERALGLGGSFPAVYPMPSAGGYPLIGRVAPPVYDPAQRLPDFRESTALARLGDIYNWRPIDRNEYDSIQRQVQAGTYRYLQKPVEFEPEQLFDNPADYGTHLAEVLYR